MEKLLKNRMKIMRYIAPLVKSGAITKAEAEEIDKIYLKTSSVEAVADSLREFALSSAKHYTLIIKTAGLIENDETLKKNN